MLNNHPLGIYEKALDKKYDWITRLNQAKQIGFDYMEICIDENDERIERLYWNGHEKRKLKEVIEYTQLPIRSMCLSAHRRFPFGSKDPKIAKTAYEIMEKAIDFASDIGIRLIQLAGYDVYYEASTPKSKSAFFEGLKWAVELASSKQVMIATEIMDTDFYNSIIKHLWYEEKIKSPWFGVYPDVGNLTAWGNDVVSEFNKGIASITAVHLKDTLAVTPAFGGKFKNVPFGEGCVDFPLCFSTLDNLEYSGSFLIENWHQEGIDDVEQCKKDKVFIEEQYKKSMDLK